MTDREAQNSDTAIRSTEGLRNVPFVRVVSVVASALVQLTPFHGAVAVVLGPWDRSDVRQPETECHTLQRYRV